MLCLMLKNSWITLTQHLEGFIVEEDDYLDYWLLQRRQARDRLKSLKSEMVKVELDFDFYADLVNRMLAKRNRKD